MKAVMDAFLIMWEYNFVHLVVKLLRRRVALFNVLWWILRTAPPDIIEILGWSALWGWSLFLVSPLADAGTSDIALLGLTSIMPLVVWALLAFQVGTAQLYFLLTDNWTGRRVAAVLGLGLWTVFMIMSFSSPYPPPVTVMFVVAVLCALWLYWRLGLLERDRMESASGDN